MVRDVPIDIDLEVELNAEPDRQNLRTVFREWELRDPLRRLEEALEAAELDAIPRPEAPGQARRCRHAKASRSDIARLQGDELVLVATPPEIPEGELLPREPKWRFAAYAGGGYVLKGEMDDPREIVEAAGTRPTHRARRQGAHRGPAEPRLRHRGRRLPARPRPPRLPARRDRRGARAGGRDRRRARHRRRARQARGRPASARRSRERGLTDLLNDIELPLVRVLRETEKRGIKLDTRKLEIVSTRIKAEVADARARDLGARRRGVRARLARSSSA